MNCCLIAIVMVTCENFIVSMIGMNCNLIAVVLVLHVAVLVPGTDINFVGFFIGTVNRLLDVTFKLLQKAETIKVLLVKQSCQGRYVTTFVAELGDICSNSTASLQKRQARISIHFPIQRLKGAITRSCRDMQLSNRVGD